MKIRARVVESSGTNSRIEIGLSSPVCWKLPRYGPHESNIRMYRTNDLLKNDLIEGCKGPWGPNFTRGKTSQRAYIKYCPLDCIDCIEYRSFDYNHYGKSVFNPNIDEKSHTRNDIITYSHA